MSKRKFGKEIIEGLQERTAWRQGKVSAQLKMTRGSGNVFLDVGFPPAEADNMMLRAQLMSRVRDAARGASQREAAKRFGITQPRLNDVLRGRIDKFSLDALVNMLAHAGLRVELRVKKAAQRKRNAPDLAGRNAYRL